MSIVPSQVDQSKESWPLMSFSGLQTYINQRLVQTGFKDASEITKPLESWSEQPYSENDLRKTLLVFEFSFFWATDP